MGFLGIKWTSEVKFDVRWGRMGKYENYQKINKWIIPNEINIVATENDKRNTIDIEYKNIEFDEAVRFPYKIPDGYKEIVLNKNDF